MTSTTPHSKQHQIQELQSKVDILKKENAALRQFKDNVQKSMGGDSPNSVAAGGGGKRSSASTQKILPKKGEKNVLITSALPYVNNVPHLGNIIGAVLSADVYARYCRQRGVNTLYICGTDEYGTATETKALQEGLTPQQICDKYHKIHASIYEWFDIKFDHFGRTSTQKQTEIAQHIFKKIQENDLLNEHETEQFFCDTCERFLADRFVHGTCPHCEYDDARGDQCDQCGKLLEEPSQLIKPRCSICNTEPRLKKSSHLYIKLPEIQPDLTQWFEKSSSEGKWTNVATSITKSWLKEGLLDRCITRDLKWGTPVPDEKFKDKVFYVWFDAPIGYISITANYTEEWKQWWQNPDDVELIQFMGKDNVPFHSVVFPSSLLATKEKWTMVNSLSSTSYLNYEDTAFSKSRGTGVFGDHAKETGIPSFAWRYYLLAVRPVASDSAFEWEDFAGKTNNELIANFGNFANRALKFIGSNFDNKLPAVSQLLERDERLIAEVNPLVKEYIESMDQIRLKEALYTAMAISKLGNQYLQDEKPWVLVKNDLARCATVLNVASHLVLLLSALLEPFVPALSEKLLQQLNFTPQGENMIPDDFKLNILPVGHTLGEVSPLVNKILAKQVEEFKAKYGAKRQDQAEPFTLDLRVGEIKEVTDHPGADLLYLLKVDIGREENLQIAGGLKSAYPEKSDLVGKKVIVVANLKAANFKGEQSEGMLLASKKKDKMELLDPTNGGKDLGVKLGTIVAPENAPLTPAKEATRKILQAALKQMKTGANGRAEFSKLPLVVRGTKHFAQSSLGKGAKIA